MKIGIVSFKGGVGKTTTAIHLASALNRQAATMLIDGDLNRSALAWSKRGENQLGVTVLSEKQAAGQLGQYQHAIFDTAARPSDEDLTDLSGICDKLILVTSPDAMALDALFAAIKSFERLQIHNYKIALTMVAPVGHAGRDAREAITAERLPLYKASIRRFAVFTHASLRGLTVDRISDPYANEAQSDIEALRKEVMK